MSQLVLFSLASSPLNTPHLLHAIFNNGESIRQQETFSILGRRKEKVNKGELIMRDSTEPNEKNLVVTTV